MYEDSLYEDSLYNLALMAGFQQCKKVQALLKMVQTMQLETLISPYIYRRGNHLIFQTSFDSDSYVLVNVLLVFRSQSASFSFRFSSQLNSLVVS